MVCPDINPAIDKDKNPNFDLGLKVHKPWCTVHGLNLDGNLHFML